MDEKTIKALIRFQRNEKTEFAIYSTLAKRSRGKNREIFQKIARDEAAHYAHFKKFTGVDVNGNPFKTFFYLTLAGIFGITFAIKLMERGEDEAHDSYNEVLSKVSQLKGIAAQELKHENALMGMIDEEKLGYLSSMVLAINNALQELTGVVVGLAFALRDSKMTGITALITGIAATLAMVASEYLSQKSEGGDGKDPAKAAVYTGVMYLTTVTMIVGPFFLMQNYLLALALAVFDAVLIMFVFSMFMAVVKDMKFKKSFLEVFIITAIVVGVSYGIGTLIRMFLLDGKA
jgi:VIT1/CCC1 family predicted Fe2+/Mn2+ transporter